MKSANTSARKEDWIVDDYFYSGERIEPWMGKKVVKYHRTIEEYFQMLKNVGFTITDIREGKPIEQAFISDNEYKRRMRLPLFLLVSCEKQSQ
ncbi:MULTISPECIES: hypothetical protein [Bacillus]|uniref:hypothetical protein n=1 Tax=Bacillus TaxID=1386 RepID=UPI0002E94086|nr:MULTISPECIES: hypothetical protein [Bacillus]